MWTRATILTWVKSMTLRFPYRREVTHKPVFSLGGCKHRPRPLVTVSLIGSSGSLARQAYVDSLADDTVFPEILARQIGVDLTGAPVGEVAGVGGSTYPIRYAAVRLRLTDGHEFRKWPALVGFTSAPLRRPLLGYAGCLQFFSAAFHGEREELELTVNGNYPGT
jgi:hypothetical protein